MKFPCEITPGHVYDLQSVRAALGLPKSTLPREIRLGRLRVSKRAGRYFILGEWLMEWLRDGEVCNRVRAGQTIRQTCFAANGNGPAGEQLCDARQARCDPPIHGGP
jgi:hypothetical protein